MKSSQALVQHSETLGSNTRETRATLRDTFAQGFYVCLSGKKRIRTLHRLGACYQIPGVDYLEYAFHCKAMPKIEDIDCMCKLCARKGIRKQADDSSQTATSSSSCDGCQRAAPRRVDSLMIPKRSAAQIACVRARTRAAVKRPTLPPAVTRRNRTCWIAEIWCKLRRNALFFSFCVSLLRLGFLFCVLFSGLVWSLVLCWSPGAWIGLVSGWAGCVVTSGVPLRGEERACGAAVAALFSWPARKTCRFFTFSEFAQQKPVFKRSVS